MGERHDVQGAGSWDCNLSFAVESATLPIPGLDDYAFKTVTRTRVEVLCDSRSPDSFVRVGFYPDAELHSTSKWKQWLGYATISALELGPEETRLFVRKHTLGCIHSSEFVERMKQSETLERGHFSRLFEFLHQRGLENILAEGLLSVSGTGTVPKDWCSFLPHEAGVAGVTLRASMMGQMSPSPSGSIRIPDLTLEVSAPGCTASVTGKVDLRWGTRASCLWDLLDVFGRTGSFKCAQDNNCLTLRAHSLCLTAKSGLDQDIWRFDGVGRLWIESGEWQCANGTLELAWNFDDATGALPNQARLHTPVAYHSASASPTTRGPAMPTTEMRCRSIETLVVANFLRGAGCTAGRKWQLEVDGTVRSFRAVGWAQVRDTIGVGVSGPFGIFIDKGKSNRGSLKASSEESLVCTALDCGLDFASEGGEISLRGSGAIGDIQRLALRLCVLVRPSEHPTLFVDKLDFKAKHLRVANELGTFDVIESIRPSSGSIAIELGEEYPILRSWSEPFVLSVKGQNIFGKAADLCTVPVHWQAEKMTAELQFEHDRRADVQELLFLCGLKLNCLTLEKLSSLSPPATLVDSAWPTFTLRSGVAEVKPHGPVACSLMRAVSGVKICFPDLRVSLSSGEVNGVRITDSISASIKDLEAAMCAEISIRQWTVLSLHLSTGKISSAYGHVNSDAPFFFRGACLNLSNSVWRVERSVQSHDSHGIQWAIHRSPQSGKKAAVFSGSTTGSIELELKEVPKFENVHASWQHGVCDGRITGSWRRGVFSLSHQGIERFHSQLGVKWNLNSHSRYFGPGIQRAVAVPPDNGHRTFLRKFIRVPPGAVHLAIRNQERDSQ